MRPIGRAAVLAVAVSLLAGGCSLFADEPGPADTARAFLDAWQRADTAAAAGQTDDPAGATAGLDALRAGLGGAKGTLTLGEVTTQGEDRAAAAYTARWEIPAVAGPWEYAGRCR